MESTSSCSSRLSKIALRNNRAYMKKVKVLKKKRAPKVFEKENNQVQLAIQEQFNVEGQHEHDHRDDVENHELFDYVKKVNVLKKKRGQPNAIEKENDHQVHRANKEQIHDQEEHRNEYELEHSDDVENQEPFDRRDELDNQEPFKHPEHAEDWNRENGVPDDNGMIEYRRKEKQRREKERIKYKEIKKDMAALHVKVDPLMREVKSIKSVVRRWDDAHQPDTDEEMEEFEELPPLPLQKRKSIALMEHNAATNRTYKKQFIAKMRTVGGSNVKNNVINIFKMLFSSKLKTKICWMGSPRKRPFKQFTTIVDCIRQAVKIRHKCSISDIENECKLRFKQAEKDYSRELL